MQNNTQDPADLGSYLTYIVSRDVACHLLAAGLQEEKEKTVKAVF